MNILVIHQVESLKKVTYEIHHPLELFSLSGHKTYTIDVLDPGIISFNETVYFLIPFTLASIDSLLTGLMLLLMSVVLFSIDRILRRGM